jgi:hypothetical protein
MDTINKLNKKNATLSEKWYFLMVAILAESHINL